MLLTQQESTSDVAIKVKLFL